MSRQLQIPQYTTGTVAVTGSSGNWTLAGTGTVWTSPDGVTQWTIAVGDIVVIPSANAFGFVGAINSNTSISLAYWSGSTVSAGASYVINRLTGLPSAAAAGLVQSLLALGSTSNPFAALSALVGSGKINFTTDGSNNIILQVRTASGYTDSNYVTAFTINPLTGIVTQAGSRTTVNDINYSALTTDRLIAYTAITAARTVTLPSAASFPTGVLLRVLDESGSCSGAKTITVTAAGSDTIDGASTLPIDGPYVAAGIESNGSNKWTIVEGALALSPNLVGIGTAPDPSNPLSVYGASALFNGANFNVTINKSASGNTASFLFQDAFSGRAQVGLTGSDNLTFKTSSNGSTWNTALVLDAATGRLTIPSGFMPGTATQAPITLSSGTNLTTAAAGAIEYDGAAFYSTVAASSRGVVPSEQFVCLSSPYTLTSQTAAQQLFNATTNGALTLAPGTYRFDCLFSLTSMSATTQSFGFALGGTATFTQEWEANAAKAALATASTSLYSTFNTAANTALTANSTSTTGYAVITGVIRVTVAGTVIPQVSLGVAAAAVVGANSCFRISPLGSASAAAVGNWS